MNKTWSVARREYAEAIRSKAFIIGLAITPILITFAVMAQKFASEKVDLDDRRFAVVDHTGQLFAGLKTRAQHRNENEIFSERDESDREQKRPRFVPLPITPGPDAGQRVDLDLSKRVRKGELFGFVIVGPKTVEGAPAEEAAISYYTETPSYSELPNWIRHTLNDEIRRIRFDRADLDRALIAQLNRQAPFKQMGLVKVTREKKVVEAQEENELATFVIPAATAFLIYMIVMTSCPPLLSNVLEEKMQKIAELLVASVSPFELMMGKLLGVILLSATLSVVYIGGLLYLAHMFGLLASIALEVYLWLPVFLILALLMYGSIFAAMGAACSELRDTQSMMTPAMVLAMIPMFCLGPILQAPNGPFAQGISLFPPTAPVTMMLRLATSPGPPLWEVVASVVLTTIFVLFSVWAGAKIFRIGILSAGKTPSYRRLLQWVFSHEF